MAHRTLIRLTGESWRLRQILRRRHPAWCDNLTRKTDSAIRITHLLSGIVVECQDERSQHKNRSRAMSLLKAKLLAGEQQKQQAAMDQTRRLQVGSGDRSERIRTYNFPQGRVTDHRINLTLYQLPDILLGDLDPVIEPLIQEYQADQLAALAL